MTKAPVRRAEWLAVLAGCAAASLAAVAWSWTHGALLNYGDAIAHLHIARRMVDCRFPGISELGSVWLPLPHILMIPFVLVDSWWANGIAGMIPSALAYLAGCAGLYRLARLWMKPAAAALALAFFALNPNLLYLQTTAMTEPLFVCEMIWVVVWLVEWRTTLDSHPGKDPEGGTQRTATLLLWIAAALVAAILTRYDGWIMALLGWSGVGVALLRRGALRPGGANSRTALTFWLASVVVVAVPLLWFLYNATYFGDWLAFARGPYSAKAIELRTAAPGWPPHPGWHNPWVSLLFFLKVAEMDAATAAWGNTMLILSALGTVGAWVTVRRRAFAWTLLLWLPVPFYAYSVAYGSVPIFLPAWWPHSWYNTRYGMELLPALALGLGFAVQFLLTTLEQFKPRWQAYATAVLAALVAWNAYAIVRQRPLVYVEGTKNLHARRPLDADIPPALKTLEMERPGSTVLMNTSVYPEIVALTGIPLRQTINESDREIYRNALDAPAGHAAIVLAFDGDEIDRAVRAHPERLIVVGRYAVSGQPTGTIYVSDSAFPKQHTPA